MPSAVVAIFGASFERTRKGRKTRYLVALDWRPVPAHEGADRHRHDEVAASVEWCREATFEDVAYLLDLHDVDVPDGVFVVIVRIRWCQGMEDCDEFCDLVASYPVNLFAWDTGFALGAAATVAEHDGAENETHDWWEANWMETERPTALTKADAEKVAALYAKCDAGWARKHALTDTAPLTIGPVAGEEATRSSAPISVTLKNPTAEDLSGLLKVYQEAERACTRDGFERAVEALEDLGTPDAMEAIAMLQAIPGAMIDLVAERTR